MKAPPPSPELCGSTSPSIATDCDGCIDGVAAATQHVEPRFDREWMRGRDERLFVGGRGRSGRRSDRLRRRDRRAGREQAGGEQDQAAAHHGSTASAPGRRGSAAPRNRPLSIMIDCSLPIVSSLVIGWPIAFSAATVSGLKLGSTRSVSLAP